jgi:hypothetical protein
MNNQPNGKDRYLIQMLASANFLAAFGGGAILALSEKAFKTPGDTIKTFLIGSTLGLGLLFFLRAKLAARINSIGGWFAIAGGAVSLIAAAIFSQHWKCDNSVDYGAWSIYLLLSLRFSLWFVARVQRPDIAAGRHQKIGWVELFYYLGIILGLSITGYLQPPESSASQRISHFILTVLIMDGLLQWLAGGLDLVAQRGSLRAADSSLTQAPAPLPYNLSWYTRAVVAVVALTIGTQAMTFSFKGIIQYVLPAALKPKSSFVLVSFYTGVACASVIYSLKKIQLEWPYATEKYARFATVFFGEGVGRQRIAFHWLSAIGAAFLALVLLGSQLSIQAGQFLSSFKLIVFLIFIAIASVIYEILALALFDHIGEEMKRLNRGGMVALAYGFMGLGMLITIFMFDGYFDQKGKQISISDPAQALLILNVLRYFLYILIACFITANLAMAFTPLRRRRSKANSSLGSPASAGAGADD